MGAEHPDLVGRQCQAAERGFAALGAVGAQRQGVGRVRVGVRNRYSQRSPRYMLVSSGMSMWLPSGSSARRTCSPGSRRCPGPRPRLGRLAPQRPATALDAGAAVTHFSDLAVQAVVAAHESPAVNSSPSARHTSPAACPAARSCHCSAAGCGRKWPWLRSGHASPPTLTGPGG